MREAKGNNIPDRTKESFDDMTGAFQAAFTKSLEVEGGCPAGTPWAC